MTGLLAMMGLSFPASELGTTFGPTLSNPEETQMIGAFIVFAIFLVWLARFHYKEIFIHAFALKNTSHSPNFMGDKLVFWGAIFGFAVLVLWFILHGVSMGQAIILLLFLLLFTMVAVRVVCQGGITYFTLTVAPMDAINTIFGLKIFSHAAMTLGSICQKVLFVDLRESVAPSILHVLKNQPAGK
jgi:hypothetical protein